MKKILKIFAILFGAFVSIILIIAFVAMSDVSKDNAKMGITSDMNQNQKDSATIVYLSSIVNEVRSDSWTAKHLLLYNSKRPDELKDKVIEPIIIRGKVLAVKSVFLYFGYDTENNMTVNFKNNDDYRKLHDNQDVVLQGMFKGGTLPTLEEAIIIDTLSLNKQITELQGKNYLTVN